MAKTLAKIVGGLASPLTFGIPLIATELLTEATGVLNESVPSIKPRVPPPAVVPQTPPPTATDVITEAQRDAQRAAAEERGRQRSLNRRRIPGPAQPRLGTTSPLG